MYHTVQKIAMYMHVMLARHSDQVESMLFNKYYFADNVQSVWGGYAMQYCIVFMLII